MEFLESTEEARLAVEEACRNVEMGEELNPELEQEIEDCMMEGSVIDPDFAHLDPDYQNFIGNYPEKNYHRIEVDEERILLEKTRQLDFYQRKVIEYGISYARRLVKARKEKNSLPTPVLVNVNGGAGCGKSTVINILKQWIHKILQKDRDDPECPYVLVTAPTGTAAAKVRGQTLHTCFSFHFGNQHYPLSDKARDKARMLYKELQVVIIDEVSMVKADMLYMLDLRLREIKCQPEKLFGGVAIFTFGDILQLRPVNGRYIFELPSEVYQDCFDVEPHWEQFKVITLEQNHRQGEDFECANLLNRMRIGKHTKEDIELLQTRIRPEGHPDLEGATYISCINEVVNKFNNVRLSEMENDLLEVEAVNFHPSIK